MIRHTNAMILGFAGVVLLAGCASAPDAVEAHRGSSTIDTKVADREGAELLPEGDTKESSDTVTTSSTDDSSAARGRLHPCTFSEAAIAADHCMEHHSPGNMPGNGFPLPCTITGCMSNGSMVYYSWEP